jgi:hypothetical protein
MSSPFRPLLLRRMTLLSDDSCRTASERVDLATVFVCGVRTTFTHTNDVNASKFYNYDYWDCADTDLVPRGLRLARVCYSQVRNAD